MIEQIDWEKSPLIPVIAQDWQTNEVLMLAYMNRDALILTIDTKVAHYYSRSKQRIWKKGESSQNIQIVKDIFIDCDNDTILLKVEQVGNSACHTGRSSCFFTKLESGEKIGEPIFNPSSKYSVIDTLYHTILERKSANSENSYTATLFKKGENSILKKVVEEAGELCFAIKDKNESEIVYEGADLLYHMLVALAYANINPDRINEELKRRFNISGLDEKRNRDATRVN